MGRERGSGERGSEGWGGKGGVRGGERGSEGWGGKGGVRGGEGKGE